MCVDGPQRALVKVPLCSVLAAPGIPSFLAFSEITSTTLNVSWGEPVAANGILQGYRVVYEPLAPVQGKARGGTGGRPHRCTALHRYRARSRPEEACWTEASWAGAELSPQPSTALCGPGRRAPLGPVSLIPEILLSCEILVLVGVAKATLSAPWWDHMQQCWPIRYHRPQGEALWPTACVSFIRLLDA